MIKEYKILCSSNFYVLEEDVNKHIKEGWLPLGNVSLVFYPADNQTDFYQSVVLMESV